jgi:hypothetical protein
MGLAAAYQAVLDGHRVDVLEASTEAGGIAGILTLMEFRLRGFITSSAGPMGQSFSSWPNSVLPKNCDGRIRRWASSPKGD